MIDKKKKKSETNWFFTWFARWKKKKRKVISNLKEEEKKNPKNRHIPLWFIVLRNTTSDHFAGYHNVFPALFNFRRNDEITTINNSKVSKPQWNGYELVWLVLINLSAHGLKYWTNNTEQEIAWTAFSFEKTHKSFNARHVYHWKLSYSSTFIYKLYTCSTKYTNVVGVRMRRE